MSPDELAVWRQRLDRRLELWIPSSGSDGVGAAMRWGLLGSGKRLRPMLMFAVGIDLGISEERLGNAACAIEMIHAASLMLDDLPCMDDASERRGRPATHRVHGEATTILAAIALIGQAFRALSGGPFPAEVRGRCVALLATVIGPDGLVRGQGRDLARRIMDESEDQALDTDYLKTGCLFHAAVLIAATLGEAEAPTCDALGRFAEHFVQAYQLADDVADGDRPTMPVIGDAEALRRLALHREQAVQAATDALGADSTLALLVESLTQLHF